MARPEPTDHDVWVIARSLMDSNDGCHVADGLACEDCWEAAEQIVFALRSQQRLGQCPGHTYERTPWPTTDVWQWDVPDRDADIFGILQACAPSCFGQAGSARTAAKIAIAALRRYGRLGELMVGDEARRLIRILTRNHAIKFLDQPVQLSGGGETNFYIDLRIITDPLALWQLGVLYSDAIVETVGLDGFDIVFGPAYAAIPLAVVTSQALWKRHRARKPHVTMRQEPKPHGRGGMIVGQPIAGKRVAMLDDVLSTSVTKAANYRLLTEHGSVLVVTVVAVDRTTDPGIVPSLVMQTGAPLRALTTLQDIAWARGYPDWATCQANAGRLPE